MLIAGTRVRRSKIGFAATFCPLRREFRIFEIRDVRQVRHLYFVPMGSGRRLHFEVRDPGGKPLYAVADGVLSGVVPAVGEQDPQSLALETHPASIDIAEESLACDLDAMQAPRGSDTRVDAFVSRIAAADYAYRNASEAGKSESISAVMTVVMLGLLTAGVIGWHQSFPWWPWAMVPGAALLPAVVYRAIDSTKRAGWSHVEPLVVDSLAALNPSEAELNDAIAVAKAHRLSIAEAIPIGRVIDQVRERIDRTS